MTGPNFSFRKEKSKDGLTTFRFAWEILSRRWSYIVELIVFGLFSRLLSIAGPIGIQILLDKILVRKANNSLIALIIALGIIAIFEIVLSFWQRVGLSVVITSISTEMLARVFRHLLRLPLAFFSHRPIGGLVQRMTDLERVRVGLFSPLTGPLIDIPFMIIAGIIMISYSVILSAILFAVLPILFGLNFVVQQRLLQSAMHQMHQRAEGDTVIVEACTQIEGVKAARAEGRYSRAYEDAIARLGRAGLKSALLNNLAEQLSAAAARFSNLAVLLVGGRMMIDGDMTIGKLVAFHMLTGYVIGPALQLVHNMQGLQQLRGALVRVDEILTEDHEGADTEVPPNGLSAGGALDIEAVDFKYPGARSNALSSISVKIKPGSFVAIVGPSGSGKSTLLRLLCRLYLADAGTITFDGVDMQTLPPEWLREYICLVPQDPTLFTGSILSNIVVESSFGAQDLIIESSIAAGVHDFVSKLPAGYDTQIENGGRNLSGGQRQRIALARALHADPAILMLDEPGRALDFETRNVLARNIRRLRGGQTLLVVTHDPVFAVGADEVIVMAAGRIVEHGSPERLVEQGGWYARLLKESASSD